jgi:putative Mg2+ transporter-C (MgtC) family protein
MSAHLEWTEILLRLALSFVAGTLVGLNRGENGHSAGLRTTLLVCLAASISMIQVNLLLDLRGKAPDSYVVLDLMRLPLGILSGMGFIGAGAILRKGDLVMGVTTAATLWFVTVMGLCFGGGQIGLGIISLCLAMGILSLLKEIERFVKRDRRGVVTIKTQYAGPTDEEISQTFERTGLHVASKNVSYEGENQITRLIFVIHWRSRSSDSTVPPVIRKLAQTAGVLEISWRGT